ncbi:2-hydroxychromene-2-carboxylate isomerase [Sneathiella sp. P13V-1]|uniref:2-hydroxychromene-2-carboxylate isomerase n=1 Tax=Sneathiella sp. P13V-1 TaxID=2697366 RepID=UPI00187B11EF|nr:2-hydroxychromene-2-carboxylate isomerase [Sneathiella sp. P13V-1]MBE7638191.1 2-hydroxychromene-2-carboxylate isomerase [Sneathiella sp. P13V-1]
MEIEYFYASYSAYAYIGAAELYRIAKKHGAKIIHKPMDLRQVMPASGSQSFAERSDAHKKYFFNREIIRWAEYRGITIMEKIPTHHNNSIKLSNCMLIAADNAGLDVAALAEEMMRAHWVDDADLDNRSDLQKMCEAVGMKADDLFAAAETDAVVGQYDANTQEAIDRDVFGSPTYFVGGDMFYGQDHLELVERALLKPFKGSWPL